MFFRKRFHRPVLITGHPRCGTASAASICRKLNLVVGDEWVGPHGIASWMMAVDDAHNPYSLDELGRDRRNISWDWLVLVVRDIKTAVPSVMVENEHACPSYSFRRKHIRRQLGLDLDAAPNDFVKAVLSITSWVRIVLAQSPHHIFRVEDQQKRFRDFLIEKEVVTPENRDVELREHVNRAKRYDAGHVAKPTITAEDWGSLDGKARDEVDWYCTTFGYSSNDE
jgi:hypothetical protein